MRQYAKLIAVVVGLTVIGVVLTGWVFRDLPLRQQSRLTDERSEKWQNVIPLDVRKWVRTETTPPPPTLPHTLSIPILVYHYVEYVKDKGDTIRQSLNTTPYTLEQQILTLQGAGYTFLTMGEVAKLFDGTGVLPIKPIVLTFDDGYRDFYTDAYPILKKYSVKATEYLIAGWTGYPNSMTESEIKEIAANGLVEFGAHTVHHAWLKGISSEAVAYEVSESKKMLETLTGKPVVSFAYPYGAFDVAAIQAVHDEGFTSAVSTVPGIDQLQVHRYFLYRLHPGGRTGESLLTWLASVKDEEISFLSTSEK